MKKLQFQTIRVIHYYDPRRSDTEYKFTAIRSHSKIPCEGCVLFCEIGAVRDCALSLIIDNSCASFLSGNEIIVSYEKIKS